MQSNTTLPADHFLYLTDKTWDADDRQSQCLALLEARPTTEDEARNIIRTAHNRHEREWRRFKQSFAQLVYEPAANNATQKPSQIEQCLSSIPPEQAELVKMHVLDGLSLRDIAQQLKIPRETLRRRYLKATKALRQSAVGQYRP